MTQRSDGFSSFAVLACYTVANASALTLGYRRLIPTAGLAGCLVLGFSLPTASVVSGSAVVAVGALVWAIRRQNRGQLITHT